MKHFLTAVVLVFLAVGPGAARAQALIDKGFVHGWNLMVDPSFGNGCLIQSVYEDLSVVRLGFDAQNKRGYFAVYNRAWGDIKKAQSYNVKFDLDGQSFEGEAIGVRQGKVPGAIVFFKDRNFVQAIAQRKNMTVFGQNGQQVMAIDLAGTDKAIEYARKCQDEMGW